MADTGRKTSGTGSDGAPAGRDEELSAILQRIADHISEVERRHGQSGAAGAPAEAAGEPAAADGGALADQPAAGESDAPAGASPDLLPRGGNLMSKDPADWVMGDLDERQFDSAGQTPSPLAASSAEEPGKISLRKAAPTPPMDEPAPGFGNSAPAMAGATMDRDLFADDAAVESPLAADDDGDEGSMEVLASNANALGFKGAQPADAPPVIESSGTVAETGSRPSRDELPVWQDDPQEPAPTRSSPRRMPGGMEPPALRSALADPQEKSGEAGETDIREDTAEQWDRQSAEELTQLYESGVASEADTRPLRSMLNLMADTAPPGMPLPTAGVDARHPVRTASEAHRAAGAHQADGAQLDDLARRIESALERLAPMSAVEGLSEQFAALEERIVDTLGALAERADVAGNGDISGALAELSSQVSRAEEKLARLDDVEARLDQLGAKLSDEQVVELFGGLVPTAEELTRFAEDAATRSAERTLEAYVELQGGAAPVGLRAPVGGDSNPDIRTLNELLAAFMDDRRRTDAGTQEALETLQLAMQHVLDRVEQLDAVGGERAPLAAVGMDSDDLSLSPDLMSEPEPDLMPEPESAPARAANPAGPIGQREHLMGMARSVLAQPAASPVPELETAEHREPVERHERMEPDLPPSAEAHALRDSPVSPLRAAREEVSPPPSMPDEFDLTPEPRARHIPEAEAPPAPSPSSDRRALIEMARKAAERAQAEAGVAAAGDKAKGKGKDKKAKAKAARAEDDGADVPPKLQVRPGILIVTGLAAALLAGYWYLAPPRFNLLGANPFAGAPAVVEQIQPASRAPASEAAPGGMPDIQTDDNVRRGPASPSGQLPGAPDRSSAAPGSGPEEDGPRLENALLHGGPVAPGPQGISLALGRNPATISGVMRAREAADMARRSEQTGRRAVSLHGVPGPSAPVAAPTAAPVTEAAAVPLQPEPVRVVAARPAPETNEPRKLVTGSVGKQPAGKETAQQLTLPPALIGPLSLRLAAAKGDPAAQLEIAARYAEGKGVPPSLPDAADWYARAAEQGVAVAQYRLGALYERGMGVTKSLSAARHWYERAAKQGNIKAMHNLAVILTSQTEGRPDYAQASRWFTSAAEHGLTDSQYNLGVLLEGGIGVSKNPVAALKWYMLAAKGGDIDATSRRDALIARLPPAGVQAANASVAKWKAKPEMRLANNLKAAGDAWKRRQQAAR